MEMNELVTLYTSAWSEPDRALRQKLLDQVWAEDGTYTDPPHTSQAEKGSSITSVGSLSSSLEPTLWLPVGSIRITTNCGSPGAWCLRMGVCLWRESTSAELSADGKLHRIVGSFGPLVPPDHGLGIASFPGSANLYCGRRSGLEVLMGH